MTTFAKRLAEAASPVSSLCSSAHYMHSGFIVFRVKIGINDTGGNDYWVTMRSFGDKVDKRATIIGIVENDIVKVGDFIPLEVAQHLQAHLESACISYNAAASGRHDEEEYDQMRECMGPLAYLSLEYSKVFCKSIRYYDGPKIPGPGGLGIMNAHRDVTERFFVKHSKGNLHTMRKNANEQAHLRH